MMLAVTVHFDEGIPVDLQGVALLDMEKSLRALSGLDVRVYKDLMGDDSKVRKFMTIEQRAKL